MHPRAKLFEMAHPERVAAYQDFPGPRPTFPLGNMGAIRRRPAWEVCEQASLTHGKLTLLWMKSRPVLVVSDERLAMGILAQGQDAFEHETPESLLGMQRSKEASIAEFGLGHQEIYRHGEPSAGLVQTPWLHEWLEERMPLLRADIAERGKAFASETEHSAKPLFAALLRVVFSSLTRLTLGQELSQQCFDDYLELTLGKMRKPLGFGSLEEREDMLGTPKERLLQAIGTQISMAQRFPESGRNDLIAHLLENRYALPEGQWASALLDIYLGTCLQIASGLTSTLHLLTNEPQALEDLELELDASPEDLGFHALMHLPQLDGAYNEGWRLAPPMPFIGRCVKETRKVDLDGKTVPAGTGILVNIGVLLRDPEAWSAPNRFDPSRWQTPSGHLLANQAQAQLAQGAAHRSSPFHRLSEWTSKLILFTWLREHTLLAGEGQPIGRKDRFVSGIRIPATVRASTYARNQATSKAASDAKKATPRTLTLLPGAIRFGIPKSRPKRKALRAPRQAGS